jgi:hypothetical protein
VSLRAVALPVEHGGWGLLGEPLVLGLLIAPSPAGAAIALAALGAFLARHPLKLVLADLRRGASYPRTALAGRFAIGYSALAVAGLAGAAATGPAIAWIPVVLAAPLALAQLAYDARHRGRQLAPELVGGLALAATAAAITAAGGWPLAGALALWALLAAKAVSSVLFVRARFRLDRGLGPSLAAPLAAHVAATALAVVLAARAGTPWLAVAAFLLLLARAVRGLAPDRVILRPKQLGFRELGYGIATTVLLAAGYAFGF